MNSPYSYLLSHIMTFVNQGNGVALSVAGVIGGAFSKVEDAMVISVMGNILEPALKAAKVA